MEKHVERRSSQDKRWQEVKAEVMKRDGGKDRLIRCLTALEAMQLMRNGGHWVNTLDPAHYLPVGQYPELCYDPDNICMVNHYSHTMLDDYKDPVTGKPISAGKAAEWWDRILGTNPEQFERIKAKENQI